MAIDLTTISDGVKYLQDGYIEYAEEVITSRALPNLYDGLKPVNRRILVTLKSKANKSNAFIKSTRVVGDTMGQYHPHGDSSIYDAAVLMTQNNGSLAFPSIEGSGTFGGVYKEDPPASSRYTEMRLSADADREYFGEMSGVKMVPNFDATLTEPEVLPVSFPAVLVNSTSGIAVGFGCNIPSFNFNDVCDLVIEYIQDGACHTVIEPDFVTGGYYVRNEKELQKLMRTGSGKIKLRGKHVIDGKKINVTELPFGKTIQGLIRQINKNDMSAIRQAYDTDDFEHGAGFTVDCVNKNRVNEAVYDLYKKTDYQYTYSANITVIDNGIPVKLGVWQIIESWVKWRREVLTKEYKHRLENLQEGMRESLAFNELIQDKEKKETFVNIVIKDGREAGRKYLRENFTREQIPEDLIAFVGKQNLSYYHDGGKIVEQYNEMKLTVEGLEKDIENIDEVIINQMKGLKARYGARLERRTEVTDVDYNFVTGEEENIKPIDDSPCFFEFNNGFLKKLPYKSRDDKFEFGFDGKSNDTLICFDNRGRVLRVYADDIPLISTYDLGTYLPRYFDLTETDDYKITYVGVMTGEELMLLYTDGYIGFVDTSEWVENNRRIKVIEKGIHPQSAQNLGVVLNSWDEMIFATDTAGRVACVYTNDIKHKHRTARTRAIYLKNDTPIDSYAMKSVTDGMLFLSNLDKYCGKMTKLDINDFHGDEEDFTML